jgi:hypothetical protein
MKSIHLLLSAVLLTLAGVWARAAEASDNAREREIVTGPSNSFEETAAAMHQAHKQGKIRGVVDLT